MPSPSRKVISPMTRALRWGSVLVVAMVGAVACQANNIPTAYGEVTQKSFLETCTGNVPDGQGTTTTLASSGYCRCAYQVFVDQVPYDDNATKDTNKYGSYMQAPYHPNYEQLNKDLRDNPNKINELPDPVKAGLKGCSNTKEIVTAGSTPSGSTPPGTGPPGSAPPASVAGPTPSGSSPTTPTTVASTGPAATP